MSILQRRRFWNTATVSVEPGGFAVALDDRPLVTPGNTPLRVPSRALAAGIAAEWQAVEAEIRPETMPLTRAANTAIDRVRPDPGPLITTLADYGGSDLICYRAEGPEALCERQAAAWDPLLEWSDRVLAAPLAPVTGVMFRPQPAESLAALRAAVAAHDPFALTGLSELVTLSGSLIIGLVVARGVLSAAEAWPLSRIDEIWQAEQWGHDAEAEADAERRRAAFLQAETFLRLLAKGPRDLA